MRFVSGFFTTLVCPSFGQSAVVEEEVVSRRSLPPSEPGVIVEDLIRVDATLFDLGVSCGNYDDHRIGQRITIPLKYSLRRGGKRALICHCDSPEVYNVPHRGRRAVIGLRFARSMPRRAPPKPSLGARLCGVPLVVLPRWDYRPRAAHTRNTI